MCCADIKELPETGGRRLWVDPKVFFLQIWISEKSDQVSTQPPESGRDVPVISLNGVQLEEVTSKLATIQLDSVRSS